MKTIYLIRHAKSNWKEKNQKDFDRTLNSVGEKEAELIGKDLLNELPDLMLISGAKRTLQTAEIISEQLQNESIKLEVNESIYEASPESILSTIQSLNEDYRSIYLVGHNPGISMLLNLLTNESVDFQTATVAKVILYVDQWSTVFPGTGSINWVRFVSNAG